jgi:hypothetical protein
VLCLAGRVTGVFFVSQSVGFASSDEYQLVILDSVGEGTLWLRRPFSTAYYAAVDNTTVCYS